MEETKDIEVKELEIMTDENGFKYTKEDLTVDGLFTVEANLRKIEFLEQEKENSRRRTPEEEYRIEMTRKVICICLYKMGKNALTNTYSLSDRERETLRSLMSSFNGKQEKDINEEFNQVCRDDVFKNGSDYSKYPVYSN